MADDYTPSEARICIDFCTAAVRRGRPDGSFMSMEEADAAFSRWLAAHDAQKRAEWEAEQGEPEWEYGISSGCGSVDYIGTRERVEEWVKHFEKAGAPLNDVERIVRRRKVGLWLPVDEKGGDR